MLCIAHGLRYDPQSATGCVLCQREPAHGRATTSTSSRALWLALLLALAAGAALFTRVREVNELSASVVRSVRGAIPSAVQTTGHPLRVLFVGNSLTSVNNLPAMIASLAEAAYEPRRFEHRMEAYGGFKLRNHVLSATLPDALDDGPWDSVVLQEQSQLPGFLPDDRAQQFFAPARNLHAAIRRAGAKTLFYVTLARRDGDDDNFPDDTYEAMQQRVIEGYAEIARELNAGLVPVGPISLTTLRQRPSTHLWGPDGQHPSVAGTYLAACIFYTHFYGHSPVGNRYTAQLDPTEARALQHQSAAALIYRAPTLASPSRGRTEPADKQRLAAQTVSSVDSAARNQALLAAQQTEAEQDRIRHEHIEADIRRRQVRSARGRVPVTIYKTTWCSACKQASAYMQRNGIEANALDIEQDAAARDAAHHLNPRGSIPTIDVDGQVMVGWNEARFEALLDAAARSRAR